MEKKKSSNPREPSWRTVVPAIEVPLLYSPFHLAETMRWLIRDAALGRSNIQDWLSAIESEALRRLELEVPDFDPLKPQVEDDGYTPDHRTGWEGFAYGLASPHDDAYTPAARAASRAFVQVRQVAKAVSTANAKDAVANAVLLACELLHLYELGAQEVSETAEASVAKRRAHMDKTILRTQPDISRLRDHCLWFAVAVWSTTPSARIGSVAEDCKTEIDEMFRTMPQTYPTLSTKYELPELATVRKWLSAAGRAGTIEIPAEARAPGRPKKPITRTV